MTPLEHRQEAERLLAMVTEGRAEKRGEMTVVTFPPSTEAQGIVARAQVHALLALGGQE